MLPSSDVSRGFLLRTGSKPFDSRFSVTFFAQAKKGDQLTSESMSCLPLSRHSAIPPGRKFPDRWRERSWKLKCSWAIMAVDPPGYFDELEGVFADEPFERAPQGELPEPKDW